MLEIYVRRRSGTLYQLPDSVSYILNRLIIPVGLGFFGGMFFGVAIVARMMG